jgi:thiamine pyrophosphate-dependent acetolactate synthase large subunit-like protein
VVRKTSGDLRGKSGIPEIPSLPNNVEDGWGSDRVARVVRELGVPFICFNPGASFRGLHDSLVNLLGNERPQMLLCLHEEAAVAIAHGYAKVTGKPLAVALHSNVGLMHATMSIFNAWCDRVPMMILGATGPVDAHKRRPFIDWIHTSRDQASITRHYTKWDDQPASVEATEEALLRGMQISTTAPCGPVYIVLDSAMQEAAHAGGAPMPDMSRYAAIPSPSPDSASLDAAVKLLTGAKSPVILSGRVSRDPKAWADRVKLAEQLGATVFTDLKVGASFPSEHELHAMPRGMFISKESLGKLQSSDVVLSLDWVDLAGTLKQAWPGGCPAKVIHISVDHHIHNGWSMDYMALPPVDVRLAVTPEAAVPALTKALPAPKRAYGKVNAAPTRAGSSGPITLKDIAVTLRDVVKNDEVCLSRLPLGWDGSYWPFTHPLDQIGHSGGGGVGSGPGMAVGAALALKGTDRLPIAILGDGDYLMGVTAIWSAVHYKIPMLTVVANNHSYFNDEVHQERVANMRGRPVENRWIGQRIADPEPDIVMFARAQGATAYGPVETHEELIKALAEAVEAVKAGQTVVVDVHVAPGYAPSTVAALTETKEVGAP